MEQPSRNSGALPNPSSSTDQRPARSRLQDMNNIAVRANYEERRPELPTTTSSTSLKPPSPPPRPPARVPRTHSPPRPIPALQSPDPSRRCPSCSHSSSARLWAVLRSVRSVLARRRLAPEVHAVLRKSISTEGRKRRERARTESWHLVSLQVPSNEVPQHVAQTEQAYQAPLLLPRRVSDGGNVLILDDDEAMAAPLADVGQDRSERVARGAGDDAGEVV